MKSKLTNRLTALEEEAKQNRTAKVEPGLYIHDGRPLPTKEEIQRRSAACPVPPLHLYFVNPQGKRVRKNKKEGRREQ